MTTAVREVTLADGRVKYVKTIADDEGDKDQRRFPFLRMLVQNRALLDCGPADFNNLAVHHDGARWVAVLETVVKGESAWLG